MEKELVLKNAIEREKGYMYYIDAEGSIWKFKKVGGSKRGKDYHKEWRKKKYDKIKKQHETEHGTDKTEQEQ
jgi:hypothetical protein